MTPLRCSHARFFVCFFVCFFVFFFSLFWFWLLPTPPGCIHEQVPFASDAARPFTCFGVKPSILSGQELLVPEFPSFEEVLPYLFDQIDSSDACGGGSAGASAPRFSATSNAAAADDAERSSWCIPFDDADGIVVKLHNFESRSGQICSS